MGRSYQRPSNRFSACIKTKVCNKSLRFWKIMNEKILRTERYRLVPVLKKKHSQKILWHSWWSTVTLRLYQHYSLQYGNESRSCSRLEWCEQTREKYFPQVLSTIEQGKYQVIWKVWTIEKKDYIILYYIIRKILRKRQGPLLQLGKCCVLSQFVRSLQRVYFSTILNNIISDMLHEENFKYLSHSDSVNFRSSNTSIV